MIKNKKPHTSSYVKLAIFTLVCTAIFFQFFSLLFQNRTKFFEPHYDKEYVVLKNAYYASQYAKKNSQAIITDEVFESFAGGAFLKGMNPIHIVHDHPPLGRYIISLSILLFNNASTVIPILLIFSFLGIFLVGKLILKNVWLSLVPVAIFANEPLLLGKLLYSPLPEPIQLPFIIFAIYFFLLAAKSKRKLMLYVAVSILLGIVISTRFIVTGAVLLFSMGFYLLFIQKSMKDIISFCTTLPLAVIVLLLTYTRTMMDGYSVLQIFGVQKYILVYHKSAFIHPFSFWPLIMLNRWYTWWGNQVVLSDPQWVVIWPFSLIASGFVFLLTAVKKISIPDEAKFLLIWIIFYSLMLSAGYTSTRYFMPILPFLYIILILGLLKVFIKYGIIKEN